VLSLPSLHKIAYQPISITEKFTLSKIAARFDATIQENAERLIAEVKPEMDAIIAKGCGSFSTTEGCQKSTRYSV